MVLTFPLKTKKKRKSEKIMNENSIPKNQYIFKKTDFCYFYITEFKIFFPPLKSYSSSSSSSDNEENKKTNSNIEKVIPIRYVDLLNLRSTRRRRKVPWILSGKLVPNNNKKSTGGGVPSSLSLLPIKISIQQKIIYNYAKCEILFHSFDMKNRYIVLSPASLDYNKLWIKYYYKAEIWMRLFKFLKEGFSNDDVAEIMHVEKYFREEFRVVVKEKEFILDMLFREVETNEEFLEYKFLIHSPFVKELTSCKLEDYERKKKKKKKNRKRKRRKGNDDEDEKKRKKKRKLNRRKRKRSRKKKKRKNKKKKIVQWDSSTTTSGDSSSEEEEIKELKMDNEEEEEIKIPKKKRREKKSSGNNNNNNNKKKIELRVPKKKRDLYQNNNIIIAKPPPLILPQYRPPMIIVPPSPMNDGISTSSSTPTSILSKPSSRSSSKRSKRVNFNLELEIFEEKPVEELTYEDIYRIGKLFMDGKLKEKEYTDKAGEFGCVRCEMIRLYKTTYSCCICEENPVCDHCLKRVFKFRSRKEYRNYVCSEECGKVKKKREGMKKLKDLEKKSSERLQNMKSDNLHLEGVENITEKRKFSEEDRLMFKFHKAVDIFEFDEEEERELGIKKINPLRKFQVDRGKGELFMIIEFLTKALDPDFRADRTEVIIVGNYQSDFLILKDMFQNRNICARFWVYDKAGHRTYKPESGFRVQGESLFEGSSRRRLLKEVSERAKIYLIFLNSNGYRNGGSGNLNFLKDTREVVRKIKPNYLCTVISVNNDIRNQKVPYYDGEVYLPIYSGDTRTKESFVICGGSKLTWKDELFQAKEYISRNKYFNEIVRANYYHHSIERVENVDHCYDCRSIVHVVKNFVEKFKFRTRNCKEVDEVTKEVIEKIQNRRRLEK